MKIAGDMQYELRQDAHSHFPDVEVKGDATLYQGDSGILVLRSLPTDKNYSVGVTILDLENRVVVAERLVNTNKSDTVFFYFTPQITDQLQVDLLQSFARYQYIVKLHDGSTVTPLYFKGKVATDLNLLTVYPKQVEGM